MGQRKRLAGGWTRKLTALRHSRKPGHLQGCAQCMSAVRRERQYLERLRGAAVPLASQDLAARLIQHTQRLAQEPVQPPRRGAWHAIRVAAVAAGGLAASAGVLALAAYAVAGDPSPEVALAGQREARSMVGATVDGGTARQAAAAILPTFSPGTTVNLGPEQLESLRGEGWVCPELAGLGFQLVSAHASLHEGHPYVELRLRSGQYHATVIEEHLGDPAGSGNAELSVTQGTPWGAVYKTSAAVLSYTSDLPAEHADDAVPELVRAGDSLHSEVRVSDPESWLERLVRGLRTLARPTGL
ncbi:hypothetical protein [Arthrobacter sp. CJ23]|uniref:hypothetical protein n=1 Tax=Arthrobacter sp. CJ23 TaxID=2972479 RepID=UPI00215CFE8A|nr:hypothetical protein [Arthrobacter sp. CJ23]UVJ38415.1 hypothetical protein NVV90_14375 [Arthrobacter sp. CJ23]